MSPETSTPPRAAATAREIPLFAQLEAERPFILAEVAARLDGWHIPGCDVTAWLAGVPVLLIAECLRGPRATIARRLFQLVGHARAAGRQGAIDPITSDRTNVMQGEVAGCALKAWAGCTLARIYLDAGRASDAVPVLDILAADLMTWPGATALRFSARIETLQARALADLALDRALDLA